MKENIIEVLVFLFDNYLNAPQGMPNDEHALVGELEEAGFDIQEINQAFDWLGELAAIKEESLKAVTNSAKSMRIYSREEQRKLSVDCRGFLQALEVAGVLDAASREIVITKAMSLTAAPFHLSQFKRIVGLIMINRAANEDNLAWLEELVNEEVTNQLH